MRAAVSTALRREVKQILDFVRHVGGKALDGVQPQPQRFRHFFQRRTEAADLVGAVAEVAGIL